MPYKPGFRGDRTAPHKPGCVCPVCKAGRGERPCTRLFLAFAFTGEQAARMRLLATSMGLSPSLTAKQLILEMFAEDGGKEGEKYHWKEMKAVIRVDPKKIPKKIRLAAAKHDEYWENKVREEIRKSIFEGGEDEKDEIR